MGASSHTAGRGESPCRPPLDHRSAPPGSDHSSLSQAWSDAAGPMLRQRQAGAGDQCQDCDSGKRTDARVTPVEPASRIADTHDRRTEATSTRLTRAVDDTGGSPTIEPSRVKLNLPANVVPLPAVSITTTTATATVRRMLVIAAPPSGGGRLVRPIAVQSADRRLGSGRRRKRSANFRFRRPWLEPRTHYGRGARAPESRGYTRALCGCSSVG